ncbi:MAG: hypothetical protein P4M15_12610 [Alphaproteobacteria bacterium]|nr:hypothetical protein [Alphaproteobacteria bacterium]
MTMVWDQQDATTYSKTGGPIPGAFFAAALAILGGSALIEYALDDSVYGGDASLKNTLIQYVQAGNDVTRLADLNGSPYYLEIHSHTFATEYTARSWGSDDSATVWIASAPHP